MNKALEKSLKDARKDGNLILGARQICRAIKDSKLVVVSRSVDVDMLATKLEPDAKENNVPLMRFDGTSVALGRACGLQFRTTAVAFSSLAETNINSIINDGKSDAASGTITAAATTTMASKTEEQEK